MDKQRLILGVDLTNEWTQVSYYNFEKKEPDTASIMQKTKIPTILCRKFSDGEWLFGFEAQSVASEGKGVAVCKFTENMSDDPVVDVAGDRVTKRELLYQFLRSVLTSLDGMQDMTIASLTLSVPEADYELADAFHDAAKRLKIDERYIALQGHIQSYAYYALSQRRDLWSHDVGLFEYDHKGLWYHHLNISTKRTPAVVTTETTDLNEYLNGSELNDTAAPEIDRHFLDAIRFVSDKKNISTFYLIGEGVEADGSVPLWMNLSLKELCQGHRHVFIGQNLFARGACCQSYDLVFADKKCTFMVMNADMLTKDVYVCTLKKRTAGKTALAEAGSTWYDCRSRKEFILWSGDEIQIHVRDQISNLEKSVILKLEGLEERPERMTRLGIYTEFKSCNVCHIIVEDMGFGSLYEATNKQWEINLDMLQTTETAVENNKTVMIEATRMCPDHPFEIPMTDMVLYSLEELCWYLRESVQTLRPELFNDQFYNWLDTVSGNHTLSLALKNYQSADRMLKDIVRLLLQSIDYLSAVEIADIYRQMNDMENQNSIEKDKMAADQYCRFGQYIVALRLYRRVVYQMQHETEITVSQQFMADVWHNMGITYFKLHHASAAVECMYKAYEIEHSDESEKNYLSALMLAGDDDALKEWKKNPFNNQSLLEEVSNYYADCQKNYSGSKRGIHLRAGLLFRTQDNMEAYEQFVHQYVDKEKKRYEMPL